MITLSSASSNALVQLGKNLEIARCRRRLSKKLLCEKAMITAQTYRRLAAGDPGISLGVMMSVVQALGLEHLVSALIDPALDETGKALENAHRQQHFKQGGRNELDTNF
jgi:transcriptional regulator with XRE-family HTH domain